MGRPIICHNFRYDAVNGETEGASPDCAHTKGACGGGQGQVVALHGGAVIARYGVEIKFRCHAEADELREVLDALDGCGCAGTACVVDRQRRSVIFEGMVSQVREALRAVAGMTREEPNDEGK